MRHRLFSQDHVIRTLDTLFGAAAAISLLLAVATMISWARSFKVWDTVSFQHFSDYPGCDLIHGWCVSSSAGGVKLEHDIDHHVKGDGDRLRGWTFSTSRTPTYPFFGTRSRIAPRNDLTFLQRAGFDFANISSGTPPSVVEGIIIPHWCCGVLTMGLPLLWVRLVLPKRRRRWRIVRGLCPGCGYDLHVTPDRCPECGWARNCDRRVPQVMNRGRSPF
jgi:hypothetical protein